MKKLNEIRLTSYKKNEFISYAIVVIFFIVFYGLQLAGGLSRSISGQLVPICSYIIMAISLNLVVGISGELSLGHAGFMSVGAFSGIVVSMYMAQFTDSELLRFVVATIVGGIMAGIIGFLIGIPVLRLRGDYLAIVTLAFGEIIRNVLNVIYVGVDKEGVHFSSNANVELADSGMMVLKGPMGATTNQELSTFVGGFILIIITLIITQNLINSRNGRAIMAIRDNRIAAESIGLSIMKYKMIAFVTSAVLAGIAGVLFGLNFSSVAPSKFGFNQSILILVFVVLGGIGNIWGGIISATVLTILPEALRSFADYRMLVYAIVLILVMLFTYNPKFKDFFRKLKGKIAFKKKGEKSNG